MIEILLNPDPPKAGKPLQVCVHWDPAVPGETIDVDIEYDPPNGSGTYPITCPAAGDLACITINPPAGAVTVTLKAAGAQDVKRFFV